MLETNTSIEIIRKLNSINVDFYNKSGLFFDNSRSYNWQGWDLLIDRLNLDNQNPEPEDNFISGLQQFFNAKLCPQKEIKILDLGCGNGRFYDFLNKKLNQAFKYIGLDMNEYLVQKARERYPYKNAQFIIENMGNADHIFQEKFDLIVVFGVMHHVPGTETRLKILQKCANLLAPNGHLVFTTWQFLNISRVAKSVVKYDTPEGQQIFTDLGIDPNELQTNDYILDWRRGITAYRYCHYYTQNEVDDLVQNAQMKIVGTYEADGIEGELNKYYICQG